MDPYVATLSILVFICKTRVRTRTLGLAVTVVCSTVRKAPCTLLGTGQMFSPWQVSFLLLCILSLRGWQGCVVDSCHPGRVCLMPCPPGAGGAHGYNDGRKGSLLLSATHCAGHWGEKRWTWFLTTLSLNQASPKTKEKLFRKFPLWLSGNEPD